AVQTDAGGIAGVFHHRIALCRRQAARARVRAMAARGGRPRRRGCNPAIDGVTGLAAGPGCTAVERSGSAAPIPDFSSDPSAKGPAWEQVLISPIPGRIKPVGPRQGADPSSFGAGREFAEFSMLDRRGLALAVLL